MSKQIAVLEYAVHRAYENHNRAIRRGNGALACHWHERLMLRKLALKLAKDMEREYREARLRG